MNPATILRSPLTWVVVVVVVLYLAFPRYEYRHVNGSTYSRRDRWTGNFVLGRADATTNGEWRQFGERPRDATGRISNDNIVKPRSTDIDLPYDPWADLPEYKGEAARKPKIAERDHEDED